MGERNVWWWWCSQAMLLNDNATLKCMVITFALASTLLRHSWGGISSSFWSFNMQVCFEYCNAWQITLCLACRPANHKYTHISASMIKANTLEINTGLKHKLVSCSFDSLCAIENICCSNFVARFFLLLAPLCRQFIHPHTQAHKHFNDTICTYSVHCHFFPCAIFPFSSSYLFLFQVLCCIAKIANYENSWTTRISLNLLGYGEYFSQ